MKFDIEDPRLTAYLLDELEADDKAEVEALLADNPEAQEFVESMETATNALGAALKEEQIDPDIGDLRRTRITRAASKSRRVMRWTVLGAVTAAAAAAVLVFSRGEDEKAEARLAAKTELAAKHARMAAVESRASQNALPAPDPLPETEMSPGAKFEASKPTIDDTKTASKGALTGRAGETRGRLAPGFHAVRIEVPKAVDDEAVAGLLSLGYFSDDSYDYFRYQQAPVENPFVAVANDPLSTFSIDVDTASYSQTRRSLLRSHRLPPPSQVRIEELINYFSYSYPAPESNAPFGVVTEVSEAPWKPQHKLVRFGIKAMDIIEDHRPRANLVFLLDVSGSMKGADKLPLLKRSFSMLLDRLDGEDRIAIVVYAGASGLALPSTPVSKRKKILGALKRLKSGGSTNGGAGIELAYRIAQDNFIEGGVNRVILATDGDFNVGTTHRDGLDALIADKAKNDVFLSVLGVGMSSHGDTTMERLADKGNGNYAYIDTIAEAKKVLVDQLHSTLVTVAKDVKLQVEFNPKRVAQYRLIGYENRVLADADFNDDRKDAGEIGAGHAVTALYEIVPPGVGKVDPLRYQQNAPTTTSAAESDELLTLKVRYKEPTGSKSKLLSVPVFDKDTDFDSASVDFKFASAVAAFGMMLRNSTHRGELSYGDILEWAAAGRGEDLHGYRSEFVQLVSKARRLRR